MSSQMWFTVLVALVGVERLAEIVVTGRNAAWSFARGGVETGRGHWPYMVALHLALLVGAVVEVWVADRPFIGWLAWPMLVLLGLAQGLRWWCISTLGRQWNARVIVVPGSSRVSAGPYRWLAHPNYLAVVVEGIALPLVHTAWVTAAVFTLLNAWVLAVRLRDEDQALRSLVGP